MTENKFSATAEKRFFQKFSVGATQLGLFQTPQSPKPTQARPTNPPRSKPRPKGLSIAPVPVNLALAHDRFYLCCGDWFAGIQLTREQAYRAIELSGESRDPETIWWAIERTIEGGIR